MPPRLDIDLRLIFFWTFNLSRINSETKRAIPRFPLPTFVADPLKSRVTDLTAGSKADTDALRLFLARTALGRPFVAPPEVPAARANALRRAFEATMKDPAFMAEAERLKLTIEPITGADLARIITEIYATPKDVVQRVSRVLGNVSGPAAQ